MIGPEEFLASFREWLKAIDFSDDPDGIGMDRYMAITEQARAEGRRERQHQLEQRLAYAERAIGHMRRNFAEQGSPVRRAYTRVANAEVASRRAVQVSITFRNQAYRAERLLDEAMARIAELEAQQ